MSANTTLLRFLIESGLDSRRKLVDAIRQGLVQVNRIVADDLRYPINATKDYVTLDGQPIHIPEFQTICLMLNKPVGVISTTRDERGRKTVIDLIPKEDRALRLHPVGRLDRDSTGLLLLTNDGNLTYRLTHPKFEREKEYLVAIDGMLKPREKQKLEKGIELSDGKTSPARVWGLRKIPPFNYHIVIHEGRKRQVRRMFEALGHHILALKRVRIGKVRLGDLKEGEMRRLSEDEVKSLLLG